MHFRYYPLQRYIARMKRRRIYRVIGPSLASLFLLTGDAHNKAGAVESDPQEQTFSPATSDNKNSNKVSKIQGKS